MAIYNRSKLVKLYIKNIGCVGNEPLEISLDDIVCLVGKNNAGKTTVLKAYELARGTQTFNSTVDRHFSAKQGEISEIILDVHIPDGTGNIDDKWKIHDNGLKLVRSRWQWIEPDFIKKRSTWEPEKNDKDKGKWAENSKAGGLDNVFNSRLPKPLRIGSLDDAAKTEELLLALALKPLIEKLEAEKNDKTSNLSVALAAITNYINQVSEEHKEDFNRISEEVAEGFKSVFPDLGVNININAGSLAFKTEDLLKKTSGLIITDGEIQTLLSQQGTGARRALFWAMLQVHNKLVRNKEIESEYNAKIASLRKELEAVKTKSDRKLAIPEEIKSLEEKLRLFNEQRTISEDPDDPALPGYLLLIDEPENALHPMAARAAQRHLYQLAKSADWQVMLTTHSPYFINPFEDHTTIVRLERNTAKKEFLSPKTYCSDFIEFEGDEKDRLKSLQQIDPSFSEIFFGSHPILVEGDTEHAAFIAAIVEKDHDLAEKVTIVRARGKAILCSIIKVLRHFKIDFSILHDTDSPYNKNGGGNGMWTENEKIRAAVLLSREAGLTVRHRLSVPDFERNLEGDEEDKDKPLNAYMKICNDEKLRLKVQGMLQELYSSEIHDCVELSPDEKYLTHLKRLVSKWACEYGFEKDIRFAGKPS
ncbi:AAA family ATPase [Pantoea cypripedii]|uniref:ATP-dependent nuclease n=1 Tax=Pantoea cypripedii TaxID=55209 RepID=UPI002FCA57FD